jgi:hypothetical protein
MPRLPAALLLTLTFSACAGLAYAQAARASNDPSSRFVVNSVVAKPAAPSLLRYAALQTPRIEGITRTSVEGRFGVREAAVGEAGFLCGLLPHPDTAGAAAAFGHDPDGRFVGAKLRLPF